MLYILIFIIAAYGLTAIISESKIFNPIRNFCFTHKKLNWLYSLLICSQCCGFWVGIVLSTVSTLFLNFSLTGYIAVDIIIISLISSGTNYLIKHFTEYMESKTRLNKTIEYTISWLRDNLESDK